MSYLTGTVREWHHAKSFGFIEPDSGCAALSSRWVFVHRNAFAQSNLDAPRLGQRYRFCLRLGPANKVQAFDLQRLNSDALVDDGVGASPAAGSRNTAAGNYSRTR